MKNSTAHRLIVQLLLIGLYNALTFILPFEYSTVFWISYVFGMIAFIAQWIVTEWTMGMGADIRSQFYGFPVSRIGWIYLIVQVPLSFIFYVIGDNAAIWVVMLIYILVFGAAAVGVVTMDLTRSSIIEQDEKLVKNVSVMRELQAKASALAAGCSDGNVRGEVKSLADSLKYSDPVSSDDTAAIESQLATCIEDIRYAVESGNNDGAVTYCKKASELLAERNQICKLTKIRNH